MYFLSRKSPYIRERRCSVRLRRFCCAIRIGRFSRRRNPSSIKRPDREAAKAAAPAAPAALTWSPTSMPWRRRRVDGKTKTRLFSTKVRSAGRGTGESALSSYIDE